MEITVRTPTVDGLGPVVATLASWQHDGGGVQLHPGDLGWQWRQGAAAVAETLRVWSRGEDVVAVGFVDCDVPAGELVVVRTAVDPSVDGDEDVARVLVRDLEDPASGVLPAGPAAVEARAGSAFRSALDAHGWQPDEPWTPLRRDLAGPVEDVALRVEMVGPSLAEVRAAVQRAAFAGSSFTVERWHAMAAGLPYERARCLLGRDDDGVAVAGVTVWSAGPGRPGLVEPMGVHRDHRGRGHGRAITLAAAAALRDAGASSVVVATPTSNVGAVATYVAAGFVADAPATDYRRPD